MKKLFVGVMVMLIGCFYSTNVFSLTVSNLNQNEQFHLKFDNNEKIPLKYFFKETKQNYNLDKIDIQHFISKPIKIKPQCFCRSPRCPHPVPTPIPASVALLSSGVISLILIKRRRNR